MEKSTQCEFCSLADFGSKSAENKAVSVSALSADFGFVLRFYKVTPGRVTSRGSVEARSSAISLLCQTCASKQSRRVTEGGQKAQTGVTAKRL